MTTPRRLTHRLSGRPRSSDGFSLPEVLISGAMMSMAMAGTAQMMVGSMASSSANAERKSIEGAINDNIQLLYQADMKLSKFLKINAAELPTACATPAAYLASALNKKSSVAYVAKPSVSGLKKFDQPKRFARYNANTGLTVVTYRFKGPEHNIKGERRIVEIHPSFQSQCSIL